MHALRLKGMRQHYFELDDVVKDKEGNEYHWKDITLVPSDGEEIITTPSQERERQLREGYAGMAMQAIIGNNKLCEKDPDASLICKSAVEIADTLISELKKVRNDE